MRPRRPRAPPILPSHPVAAAAPLHFPRLRTPTNCNYAELQALSPRPSPSLLPSSTKQPAKPVLPARAPAVTNPARIARAGGPSADASERRNAGTACGIDCIIDHGYVYPDIGTRTRNSIGKFANSQYELCILYSSCRSYPDLLHRPVAPQAACSWGSE